jgi:hypothetical protein
MRNKITNQEKPNPLNPPYQGEDIKYYPSRGRD